MYSVTIQAQTAEELQKKISALLNIHQNFPKVVEKDGVLLVGDAQLRDNVENTKPRKSKLKDSIIEKEKEEIVKENETASNSEIPDFLNKDKKGITYADVKAVTLAMARISEDTARKILTKFSVENAKQLPESQWQGYVDEAQKVIEKHKKESEELA
jgi:hypothetical protein